MKSPRSSLHLLVCIAALVSALMAPLRLQASSAAACQSLLKTTFPLPGDAASLTIDAVTLVPAASPLPEYCQVNGHLDTEIHFELQLPTTWNGKLLMSGNAGFAGSLTVLIPPLHMGLARNYAMVATDTGHTGGPESFLHRPDRVQNFQYRAVHLTALTAREIVQAYYQAAPAHAYFDSCSTGGGQAMLEAAKYPGDFDGIIAGAPQLANGGYPIWNAQQFFPGGPNVAVLPPQKVTLLSQIVLQKCDRLDGVIDGLVSNPVSCNFNPVTDLPRCPSSGDAPTCFTRRQIQALQAMHSGPSGTAIKRYGVEEASPERMSVLVPGQTDLAIVERGRIPGTSEYYFAGTESFDDVAEGSFPGSLDFSYEISGYPGDPAHYPNLFGPGLPSFDFASGAEYLRYIIFDDPNYQLSSFDFENPADATRYTSILAPQYPASPNLSAFEASGGKLIEYQGWGDTVLNPMNTIEFYNEGATLAGGLGKMQSFDRLFLIPGTLHCTGGPGPWDIDPLTALEQWVEQGQPPASLLGSNPRSRISRPVCAYPQIARLISPGLDPTVASSFSCQEP
jgi:feruloyl esterase